MTHLFRDILEVDVVAPVEHRHRAAQVLRGGSVVVEADDSLLQYAHRKGDPFIGDNRMLRAARETGLPRLLPLSAPSYGSSPSLLR